MKVLILGADGYLGRPTKKYLLEQGYEVEGIDNLSKRERMLAVGVDPLYWPTIDEQTIGGDVCNYRFMYHSLDSFMPDAIIHYAEQPSAPLSMFSPEHAKRTLENNITSTLNLAWAAKEVCPEAHILKLGTMGEYGTPDVAEIPEGWIHLNGQKMIFPRMPGSIYHASKVADTDLLWFCVRNWGLRVTDIMQGPVYGYVEDGFFAYDEIFGTVINRFIAQAVVGHPCTIYGKGGQRRGFIDLEDALQAIGLLLKHPPDRGDMQIINQITQVWSVKDLAEMVARNAREMGLAAGVIHIDNPRREAEEHTYSPTFNALQNFGLEPRVLDDRKVKSMLASVCQHKKSINQLGFLKNVRW